MRKPPLQDVIVREREAPVRGGRDGVQRYSPPPQREERYEREEPVEREENNFEDEYLPPRRKKQLPFDRGTFRRRGPALQMSPTNKKWVIIALGISAVVILSSIALSLLFAGATITVHPRQDTVTIDATFETEKNGAQGTIAFERSSIERTITKEVVALGEEEMEEKASGKIIIYNELSQSPQRIIKNTRFQTTEGLVFRVGQSVEIPGKKPDGTPGSIEITVRAEEAGEKYNIEPTTFRLPGYEESGNTEHFEKIYAKSVAPTEGGFIGIRRSVNEDERANALRELEDQLREELLTTAFESTDNPEGYHLFKEAIFFEFENLPDVPSGSDKVTIGMKGKLHGILFPVDNLEMRLAQHTMGSYTDEPIRIDNLDEVSISVEPATSEEVERPWESNVFTVSAQGKAYFIWEFDEGALKNDFAGKDKEIFETKQSAEILDKHPGIDRVEVNIRPFWKGSFPESTEDILVITELDD